MSVQDQLAPYLNRFVFLLNQNENVKLEINCKDGNLLVNFNHEINKINKVDKLQENPKKITAAQFNRLKKRAMSRAEEAKTKTKEQQELAELAQKECDMSVKIAEKAKIESEQAKREAAEAIIDANQSKLEAAKTMSDLVMLRMEEEESVKSQQCLSKQKSCLKCKYCDAEVDNMILMKEHIREVHACLCPICEDNIVLLKEHVRKVIVKYHCYICGKECISEHQFKLHKEEHVGVDHVFKSIDVQMIIDEE